MGETEEGAPPQRVWIPRETWRQEKAVVFARTVIIGPYKFLAHDRSKASSPKEHQWQALRGVRKGTPDTQLILPHGCHLWFEFKGPDAKVKEGDDQDLMLESLRALGDKAAWGRTILELYEFWAANNVPMQPNAEFQALHYDGMVDSRIAKTEAKAAAKKARSPRKAGPRFLAGKRMARRMNLGGMG